MTDQEINRAIAEAMTGVGLDEKLAWGTELLCECGNPFDKPCRGCSVNHVPHDFTDPRYLFPALEAYYGRKPVTIAFSPQSDGGWIAQVDEYEGAEVELANAKLVSALRNAFAAALGVGE